jgi:GMP synthase (glutamine-hydrolysing)
MEEMITIVDFGSQYTALIARRVCELNIYCEVVRWDAPLTAWATKRCLGYILSGSPASVHDLDAPSLPSHVLASGLPVLGICYGMQCLAIAFGGQVSVSQQREYGLAKLEVVENSPLFEDLPSTLDVWMSHSDYVERLPPNSVAIARTASGELVKRCRLFYGGSFRPHPRVTRIIGHVR